MVQYLDLAVVRRKRKRVNMSEELKETSGLMSRRSFIVGGAGLAALLGIGGIAKYAGVSSLLRPPGGQDEKRFIALCLRCQKCREVCPNGCIMPSKTEDGFVNARTPKMNFKLGWCDFCAEAYKGVPQCVKVCPSQALKLPDGATATSIKIGVAVIDKDSCLGWLLKGCRTCVDNCPYDALTLDENNRPVVVENKCNGCGLCEYVCVSLKNASITGRSKDRAIIIKPLN